MGMVSEDIKDLLEAESSLGLTFGTDLFIGREPNDPDDCVTIFDTAGRAPQLTIGAINQNELYEYPSIQIRVRNTSYQAGWELIDSIMRVLHGRANETWNGSLYTVIYCSSGPSLLDWDENNRVRFIINFDLQRRDS